MTEGNFALWVEPPLDFFHKFCFRVSEWQKNGGWRKIFCFWWTKKPIQWRSIGFDELLRRLSNDYCLMRLKRLRWKERCLRTPAFVAERAILSLSSLIAQNNFFVVMKILKNWNFFLCWNNFEFHSRVLGKNFSFSRRLPSDLQIKKF